jgi:hypothetical protein
VVRPVGDYHVNLLSAPATEAFFRRHASAVEVIPIDAMLRSRFGAEDTMNKSAYTFIIRL